MEPEIEYYRGQPDDKSVYLTPVTFAVLTQDVTMTTLL